MARPRTLGAKVYPELGVVVRLPQGKKLQSPFPVHEAAKEKPSTGSRSGVRRDRAPQAELEQLVHPRRAVATCVA